MSDDTTEPERVGPLAAALQARIARHLPATLPLTEQAQEDAEAEALRHAAEERRDRLAVAWAAMVPDVLGDPDLIDITDKDTRAALAEWSAAPVRNVILTGPVGVGKSHAGFAMLRQPHERGLVVAAANVPRLLRSLRPGGDGANLPRLIAADLLLLDDLGAERPTDWTTEQVYGLVNDRWEAKRPTLATTNVPLKAPPDDPGAVVLADIIGERVYSRLIDNVLAIKLTGPDRRRNHRPLEPPT